LIAHTVVLILARRFCSIPSKKVPKYRYPVGVSDFKKLRLSVDDRNIPYFWFDNSMLIREFYRGPEACCDTLVDYTSSFLLIVHILYLHLVYSCVLVVLLSLHDFSPIVLYLPFPGGPHLSSSSLVKVAQHFNAEVLL